MRGLVLALLLSNVVLAAYLGVTASPRHTLHDAGAQEVNADKVRLLRIAPAPSRTGPGACLEWGPFAAPELLRAQEQLAAMAAVRSRVRELPGSPVWWVHLPALRSREEADRRVRELDELGVKDARVVTDEGYRNAVSLGIFRTEEAAAAHQARLREIKVRNAAVVQRSDLLKLSTIVIVEPTMELAAKLAELRTAFAGSELKAAACTGGAG